MDRENEIIIYNDWTYDYEAEEEAAIDFLQENEMEINEESVRDAILDNLELWWETENENLEEHFGQFKHGFIIIGEIELWDGSHHGGRILSSWHDILNQCCADYDGHKLYDVDGLFCIDGVHHDGRDHYEIKALTEAGNKLAGQWGRCDDFDNKKPISMFHNELFNSDKYTELINYAKEYYGV